MISGRVNNGGNSFPTQEQELRHRKSSSSTLAPIFNQPANNTEAKENHSYTKVAKDEDSDEDLTSSSSCPCFNIFSTFLSPPPREKYCSRYFLTIPYKSRWTLWNLYGGTQSQYQDGIGKIIQKGTHKLKEGLDTSSFLRFLQNKRNKLAHEMNSHLAKDFGRKRIEEDALMITPVGHQFDAYGQRLIRKIWNLIPQDQRNTPKTHLYREFVSAEGLITRLDIVIIKSLEDISTSSPWMHDAIRSQLFQKKNVTTGPDSPEFDQKLKETAVEFLQVQESLEDSIFDRNPTSAYSSSDPTDLRYFATLSIKIDDEFVNSSRYMIRLNESQRDLLSKDPNAVVDTYPILWHQDLQPGIQYEKFFDKVFQQALQWKPEDGIDKLKKLIAECGFIYSHWTPCWRGDGAITELIMLILFAYHGFENATFSDAISPCYETLCNFDFTVFFDQFKRHLELENT